MYRRNCLIAGMSPENIDLYFLASNPHPGALEMLSRNLIALPDVELYGICSRLLINANPSAVSMVIRLLETQEVQQIPRHLWFGLSKHTDARAIDFLSKHPEKISYYGLSENPSFAAANLLRKYPNSIVWEILARNEGKHAIALMADYPDRVHWVNLAYNNSPEALTLMAANIDRIYWEGLLRNVSPAAFSLISANICEIQSIVGYDNISYLSTNPNIFTEKYDYATMRAAMDVHREELIKAAFHPRRLARHLDAGGDPDEF